MKWEVTILMPEFCKHGNLQPSKSTIGCSKCDPNSSRKITIEEGVDCPVWKLSKTHCENKGVQKREHSARQFVLECTSCGWEWRRWKKNGKPEGKIVGATMPKIVECSQCNENKIEKESLPRDDLCSTCAREYYQKEMFGFQGVFWHP